IVGHAPVDTGGQNDVIALATAVERLARDFLALAARVDVGGSQEVDGRVEGAIDDGSRLVGARAAAEHHAGQAHGRGPYAGAAEWSVFHGYCLSRVADLCSGSLSAGLAGRWKPLEGLHRRWNFSSARPLKCAS